MIQFAIGDAAWFGRIVDLMLRRQAFAGGTLLLVFACVLTGCAAQGSKQVPIDRFDYNAAIATSANEQMLINLVRLRFGEVPTFLTVGSVITQYVWSGDVGVGGSTGESLGFPAWNVGGSANIRYFERPTVTYTPLSGQEFAAQMISPVRADMVFSLVSSGWPPSELLTLTLQRINDVENRRFSALRAEQAEPSDTFARVVELIVELAKRNAIELVRSGASEREEMYLDFAITDDPESRELIRELKGLLSLDDERSRYSVTRKIVGRTPGEITIRMHSLLELMGLLSGGVAAPGDAAATMSPLEVRCHAERPADSFVAVRYDGKWFDIARGDERSKRAFGLLIYLFQVQASQSQGAAPLITVPVG